MAQKESRAVLHHKGLEPKNVRRQRGQISLSYYTNTIGKPKVQLPIMVAPKEENHQILETKKVALCHQGKSWLCSGRNVGRWFWATKANYDCTTDRMLEGSWSLAARRVGKLINMRSGKDEPHVM
jgi:hypothetical protein